MRRIATTLALVLSLLGCAPSVELLTGHSLCFPGPGPVIEGLLISDPEHGTAIKVEGYQSGYSYDSTPSDGSTTPVMWPEGYIGRQLSGGEVEVLDEAGKVVARTGGRYALEGGHSAGTGTAAFPACTSPYELAQGESVITPLPT